jgi:hypothetical protein
MILGPAMTSGAKVLQAIHALYYLPENFKLILTGSQNADQSLYKQAVSLVERDELGARVQFADSPEETDAVILPNSGMSRNRNSIAGESSEALASAILEMARAHA